MMDDRKVEFIALRCHEMNRKLCQLVSENDPAPPWYDTSEDARESCREWVRKVLGKLVGSPGPFLTDRASLLRREVYRSGRIFDYMKYKSSQ